MYHPLVDKILFSRKKRNIVFVCWHGHQTDRDWWTCWRMAIKDPSSVFLVSGQWSGSFQDCKVVCFSKYLHPKDYHPHHSVCNWKQIHDLRHEPTPLLVRLSLVKDIKTFIFSFQECKVVCRPDVSPLWQVDSYLNDLATFPSNLTCFDRWKNCILFSELKMTWAFQRGRRHCELSTISTRHEYVEINLL